MPLKVLEVDILKPRANEAIEVFWKPARGLISERVSMCKQHLYIHRMVDFRTLTEEGVENLQQFDLSRHIPLPTAANPEGAHDDVQQRAPNGS